MQRLSATLALLVLVSLAASGNARETDRAIDEALAQHALAMHVTPDEEAWRYDVMVVARQFTAAGQLPGMPARPGTQTQRAAGHAETSKKVTTNCTKW